MHTILLLLFKVGVRKKKIDTSTLSNLLVNYSGKKKRKEAVQERKKHYFSGVNVMN